MLDFDASKRFHNAQQVCIDLEELQTEILYNSRKIVRPSLDSLRNTDDATQVWEDETMATEALDQPSLTQNDISSALR